MNEQLQLVLSEAFQKPAHEITPELTQQDIPAWDSEGHLELIMAIEQAFGVEFELVEATTLRSVKAIEEALRRHAVLV